MLTSFVIAAGCSAYFVLLVQRERRGVHVRLLQSQASAAQLERFAALTAMAAGAAHELATPLGTIAVAARELERAASRVASGSTLAEDARLIREEVDRCRSILDQMMPPAPSPDGCEPLTPVMVAHDLPTWIPAAHRPQVRVTVTESAGSLLLPRSRTLQAIAALISNALDALRAPPGASLRSDAREAPGIPEVRVHLGVDQSALTVRVEDRGQGMTPEVQARLGEPFFTTKPPGQGRGLGLFLVRQLVQQVEGRLTVQSVPGHGTTIVLRLPSLEPAGAPVDGERGALREGSL
jgi:two-component system sensor histidine kinase RegB